MKYRGNTIAWMIGWAESSLRMKLATANDRQQKHAAPATTPSTNAGRVPLGMRTPYRIRPIATSTITTTIERITAVSARLTISTHAGTGVERLRLSTPLSRSATSVITMYTNDTATTPSVAIPGT